MSWVVFQFIRILLFPVQLLPRAVLVWIGKGVGFAAFYLLPPLRKRGMNNLAMAVSLNLSEKQMVSILRGSFQQLAITALDYFKLKSGKKNLDSIVVCENPQEAEARFARGEPAIFFSAHQANWEVGYLDITKRGPVWAIGRPVKNKYLYGWIVSLREMFGGKIIPPQQALKQGLYALKKGISVGIVGDQALPESSYSYPLFGSRAWTSTAPALLAYRTGFPLVPATTKRVGSRYYVHHHAPIYADPHLPPKEAVVKMMDAALRVLEEDIARHPDQWLWLHNRWKQRGGPSLPKLLRYDSIAIVLPEERAVVTGFGVAFAVLKRAYPRGFFTIFVPAALQSLLFLPEAKVRIYHTEKELFVRDWRFQLLLDFYDSARLRRYYRKLAVVSALTRDDLLSIAVKSMGNMQALFHIESDADLLGYALFGASYAPKQPLKVCEELELLAEQCC